MTLSCGWKSDDLEIFPDDFLVRSDQKRLQSLRNREELMDGWISPWHHHKAKRKLLEKPLCFKNIDENKYNNARTDIIHRHSQCKLSVDSLFRAVKVVESEDCIEQQGKSIKNEWKTR